MDDGSTDGSADIMAGYGDRVRIVKQKRAGPSAARNAGTKAASGEFLAFLDADDWWDRNCLAELWRALEKSAVRNLPIGFIPLS